MIEYKATFEEFTDTEEILLCLRKKGIIRHNEYLGKVGKTEENKKAQVFFLLEKIPNGGERAFPALLECLKEKHGDLAVALLKILEKRAESLEKDGGYAFTLQE